MVSPVSGPTPAFPADKPTPSDGEAAPVPAFAPSPTKVAATPAFPVGTPLSSTKPAPAFGPAFVAPQTPPPVTPAFVPGVPSSPAFPPSPRKPLQAPAAAFAPGHKIDLARPPSAPSVAFPSKVAERDEVFQMADQMFGQPAIDEDAQVHGRIMVEARPLLLPLSKVPLTDARALLTFGSVAQTKVSALPTRMLEIVQEAAGQDVLQRLRTIKTIVAAANVDELFGLSGGVGGRIMRMLTPPQERLNEVARSVEIESSAVLSALPGLKDHVDELMRLVAEEQAARVTLEAHIRAGEIVLAVHTKRGISAQFGYQTLEDRVQSLRVTRMAALTDAPQLTALRESYVRLVEGARSVVNDIVGLWKRQCVNAHQVLATQANARATAAAATGLRDASARLVKEIEAATRR